MNIFKKLHKLIDLCIQAAEASIKGHNAAYESFTRADQYAYRYHQHHKLNVSIEHTAREAEYKYLENKARSNDEERRFAILTAIKNLDL